MCARKYIRGSPFMNIVTMCVCVCVCVCVCGIPFVELQDLVTQQAGGAASWS